MDKISLTPSQLAERLQIAEQTLRKWRLSGAGPAYVKLGDTRNAKVRYRLEDVEAWEQSNRITPE